MPPLPFVKVASLEIFIKFYSKLYTSIKALIVKLARTVDCSELANLALFYGNSHVSQADCYLWLICIKHNSWLCLWSLTNHLRNLCEGASDTLESTVPEWGS